MGLRLGIRALVLCVAVGAGVSLPLLAQTTPGVRPRAGAIARGTVPVATRTATRVATRPTAPARPATARAATRPVVTARPVAATHPTASRPATRPATRPVATAPAPVVKTNPFLPTPILVEAFFGDLTLSPKTAPTAPAGFEPVASAEEWRIYREAFGAEADKLTGLRASGQLAFAQKLIEAAEYLPAGPELSAYAPGVRRVLLLRAAAIAYRSAGGFPTADKAVTAYLTVMDKKSPAQVGALWSVANIMARTVVTPKPERIRYDGVAAKANMQLALLLLDADQIEAAQAITKQVAYHEGWLKSDPATRVQIAQVRTEVRQTGLMIEYLTSQYQAALKNDVGALTTIYLYGRYVKGNVALVSNLPGRVPESPLAQLVNLVDAAQRGDVKAAFKAAEMLRTVAGGVSDARIRSRTLYAAMQLYDAFMASPLTEKDRVERTLARIAREGVVSDGARKAGSIDPFAAPATPAMGPAVPVAPTVPEVRPVVAPVVRMAAL